LLQKTDALARPKQGSFERRAPDHFVTEHLANIGEQVSIFTGADQHVVLMQSPKMIKNIKQVGMPKGINGFTRFFAKVALDFRIYNFFPESHAPKVNENPYNGGQDKIEQQ
jgi:hypothetical protein